MLLMLLWGAAAVFAMQQHTAGCAGLPTIIVVDPVTDPLTNRSQHTIQLIHADVDTVASPNALEWFRQRCGLDGVFLDAVSVLLLGGAAARDQCDHSRVGSGRPCK